MLVVQKTAEGGEDPDGMAGSDARITIPVGMIARSLGLAFKEQAATVR